MSNYGMLKNSEVFFQGPFMHEARKTFKTIREALESVYDCSYSLSESDVGIFYDLESISENPKVKEIIDDYYDEMEGSWNIPAVGCVCTYDDELEMVVEDKDNLPNSIYYQTSTGKNQIMIREVIGNDGEKSYLAIYRVESEKPLQLSTAMKSFGENGWDCRCIVASREVNYEVNNVLEGNRDYDIWRWSWEDYSGDKRHGYMLNVKIPDEIIEKINREHSCSISSEEFSKYSIEDEIINILKNNGIQDVQLIELSPIEVKEQNGFYTDDIRAYELPEKIEGTLIEASWLKGTGGVVENGKMIRYYISTYIKTMEPIIKSYKWTEIVTEIPPSEEVLAEINEKVKQSSLYSAEQIAEAIEPRSGEIDKLIKETEKLATEEKNKENDEKNPTDDFE